MLSVSVTNGNFLQWHTLFSSITILIPCIHIYNIRDYCNFYSINKLKFRKLMRSKTVYCHGFACHVLLSFVVFWGSLYHFFPIHTLSLRHSFGQISGKKRTKFSFLSFKKVWLSFQSRRISCCIWDSGLTVLLIFQHSILVLRLLKECLLIF